MKAQRLILEGDALRYKGDWASGNEYNENDVVTWATDGHLYEVIKAHTSSSTFDPDNPEYYKAMTASKIIRENFGTNYSQTAINRIIEITKTHPEAIVGMFYGGGVFLGKPFVDNNNELKITMATRGATGDESNRMIIGHAWNAGSSFYNGMPFRGVVIELAGTPTIHNVFGYDTDDIKFGVTPRYIIYNA